MAKHPAKMLMAMQCTKHQLPVTVHNNGRKLHLQPFYLHKTRKTFTPRFVVLQAPLGLNTQVLMVYKIHTCSCLRLVTVRIPPHFLVLECASQCNAPAAAFHSGVVRGIC